MRERGSHRKDSQEPGFEVPEHVIQELGDTAGYASDAAELIAQQPEAAEPDRFEDTDSWAEWSRTSASQAIEKWNQAIEFQGNPHFDFQESPVPKNINDLKAQHPETANNLFYLAAARDALNHELGRAASGERIGNSMELVLIPWQFFYDRTLGREPDDNPGLYYSLVELEGFNELSSQIFENFRQDSILYRRSDGTTASPEVYLSERLASEGAWGVALMQTAKPGLETNQLVMESLSKVTLEASRKMRIKKHAVGNLGIFEALALDLQEPSVQINQEEWLPANIFTDDKLASPNHQPVSPLLKGLRKATRKSERKRQVRFVIMPSRP